MIEKIVEITDKLRKQMGSSLPPLEAEVNSIIDAGERSPEKIENLLDTFLDYLHMGLGEKQFLRLNSYYQSFCPKNSETYDRFYHEIID